MENKSAPIPKTAEDVQRENFEKRIERIITNLKIAQLSEDKYEREEAVEVAAVIIACVRQYVRTDK